jgi:hypothetical protein
LLSLEKAQREKTKQTNKKNTPQNPDYRKDVKKACKPG